MNSLNIEKIILKLVARIEIAVDSNTPVDDHKADHNDWNAFVCKVDCMVQFLLANMYSSPEGLKSNLLKYIFYLLIIV